MCPSVKTICLVAVLLTGTAHAETPLVAIPAALQARPGESLVMVVPARGVQIYECRSRKDQPTVYEWAFVAPQATLFDPAGKKIGTHYEGPSWEAEDGSIIKGSVAARADASPNGAQPGSIPWLLLNATATGTAGGTFSAVTAVQRVNTQGGLAPKTTCSEASAGAVARVPYTADYYLLGRR